MYENNIKSIAFYDFDGTITNQDICDVLVKNISPKTYEEIGKAYEDGLITHDDLNEYFVKSLSGNKLEINRILKELVNTRTGFKRSLKYFQSIGIAPVILSTGWDLYIEKILSDLPISFPETMQELTDAISQKKIPIICNHVEFNNEDAEIKFPWKNDKESISPNKQEIINYTREKLGINSIISIGNSSGDFEMLKASDFAFSTDNLSKICKTNNIQSTHFEDFDEVLNCIKSQRQSVHKILSFPSYHPYTKRFNNHLDIEFLNPNDDSFERFKNMSIKEVENEIIQSDANIIHIQFEYKLISEEKLLAILKAAKNSQKKIIWTCHDRKNLLNKTNNNKHEQLLVKYADKISTLTNGCSNWIQNNLKDNPITVIQHGYITHPSIINQREKEIRKEKNKYSLLIGDFRKNKDFFTVIESFLEISEKNNIKLCLIFRTPSKFLSSEDQSRFSSLINNKQIEMITGEEIEDQQITNAFLNSHGVILPYLWGTHSGQIELAKDCGCHVLSTNVGYYNEQNNLIHNLKIKNEKIIPNQLISIIKKVSKLDSLKPSGQFRANEFSQVILPAHKILYNS